MDIADHLAGFVRGPGLYRMPADVYHADPAPEPSLSSSVARILVEQSAEHARLAHPRLADQEEPGRDPTRPQEIGTAAHKLILERGTELVVIDEKDYRKDIAKTRRADAYAAGRCPILLADYEKAETLASEVATRLAGIPGCAGFLRAPSEVVAIAQHRTGAWLRIMMDRVEIRDGRAIIWDVKTGEQSAAPQGIGRRIAGMGMEVQAALYVHVLATLAPHLAGRIAFRWIFIENDAPYGLTVAEAPEGLLEVGRRKVALALHRWNAARKADAWPGYPTAIITPELPAWADQQWSEREDEPDNAGVNWSLDASPFRPLDQGAAA